jgi:uncharacterized protein YoxC
METNSQTLLIIFVGLTGIAVLLQACILLAIFISLRKTAQAVLQATEDMKATILPVVHSTRELMERITPQVMTISVGIADLTATFQRESRGVSVSVSEIMERVSHQTARLDSMLTGGLNAVEKAGNVLESAVALPIRQANGIFAAARAMVDTYLAVKPHSRQSNPVTVASLPAHPEKKMYPVDRAI